MWLQILCLWQYYHVRFQLPFQNAVESGSAISYIANVTCLPCTLANDFNDFRNTQGSLYIWPLYHGGDVSAIHNKRFVYFIIVNFAMQHTVTETLN